MRVMQKYELLKNKQDVHELMVLHIPLYKAVENGVYIILYKKYEKDRNMEDESEIRECPLTYRDLWDIRNVLFLRDKLEAVLRRDITALKNMIHKYDYVEKIGDETVKFLHISDLHVAKKRQETLEDILRAGSLPKQVDLLLITGDIVQGAYTATGLTENYAAAVSVIKELAIRLWGTERGAKKYVRSDWNKRIIISTGNHDYASMNELEALNEHRATLSGSASGELGNTMVKHSYFINFLHNLLGKDIDDVVQYDLNEMINFEKLDVTVININSNSGVNPYRTNKVKIDADAVDRMYRAEFRLSKVIYMMHHTPMYQIDYLEDIYYLKDKMIPNLKEEIMKFGEYKNKRRINVGKIWINLIKGIICNDAKSLEKICCGESESEGLLRRLLAKIYTIDKAWFKELCLFDFEYYLDISKKERKTDDRCRQLTSKLREYMGASRADQCAYINFAKKTFCRK